RSCRMRMRCSGRSSMIVGAGTSGRRAEAVDFLAQHGEKEGVSVFRAEKLGGIAFCSSMFGISRGDEGIAEPQVIEAPFIVHYSYGDEAKSPSPQWRPAPSDRGPG